MQLAELQNATLFALQQSELVNFGFNADGTIAQPNWSAATNPAVTEQAMNFMLNRAYVRVITDLSDVKLTLQSWTFFSLAQTSNYTLPPFPPTAAAVLGQSLNNSMVLGTANPTQPGTWGQGQWGTMIWGQQGPPAVQRITRVLYNPQGQPWTQEMEGGVRLVSWQQFQRYSAFGYLRPFTYNIIPDFCAISPDRKSLCFFPGTADAGDAITIEYVPELTPGSWFAPLVSPTDTPAMPDAAQDLIVLWAAALIWPKLRGMLQAVEYQKMYQQELMRVRDQLGPTSLGDTQRIRSVEEGLSLSYPIGGILSLP